MILAHIKHSSSSKYIYHNDPDYTGKVLITLDCYKKSQNAVNKTHQQYDVRQTHKVPT